MKKIIIMTMFLIQTTYSQIKTYNYSSTGTYEYNESLKTFKFNENSDEETKSEVKIDETQKTITISRFFIPTVGEPEKTLEKYYYVKKEFVTNNYRYYGIDLINKKYLEFIITEDSTNIAENCDGFTGCKKVTTLKK